MAQHTHKNAIPGGPYIQQPVFKMKQVHRLVKNKAGRLIPTDFLIRAASGAEAAIVADQMKYDQEKANGWHRGEKDF